MSPTPLYQPRSDDGAYQLRYSWTGWPAGGSFAARPERVIEESKSLWERDGLRVLEHRWTDALVQILFSARPDVSPEVMAARAKGRLDHALRAAKVQMPFSRKVALRAVGDNTRRDIEAYLARQVAKERFADPTFAQRVEELTVVDPRVDLSAPAESARGRYWYNLHLVLVVAGRVCIHDFDVLRGLRDAFLKIAAKKGHAVGSLAVMPDHLHAALRPPAGQTPLDIVFAYQNNLASMTGQGRIWSDGFYVGTFGDYAMSAVRGRASTTAWAGLNEERGTV